MEIQDHEISKKCFAFGNMRYLEIVRVLRQSKSPSKSKKQKSPLNLKTVKLRNPNKNRSMDHNNLSIKAILMKYHSLFVASLFQKRPPCFPERCLLFDSQRVNENARVIRSSLPMMLCE